VSLTLTSAFLCMTQTLVSSQRLCKPGSFPGQLLQHTHTPSTRWASETPSCRPISLSDDTFLYFTRVMTLRILFRSVLFPARLRLSWVIKDGKPNVILFSLSLCGFNGAEQIFPTLTCGDLRLSHTQSSFFFFPHRKCIYWHLLRPTFHSWLPPSTPTSWWWLLHEQTLAFLFQI